MATTTNYGWETPDDTDLVKDGALAQRTTANSIDSTLGTALNNKLHAGLVLVKTQTIGTGVSSVTVTNSFSATYDNYKIIVAGGATSISNRPILYKLGSTTSGYNFGGTYTLYGAGSLLALNAASAAQWDYCGTGQTDGIGSEIDIINPFLTKRTYMRSYFSDGSGAGSVAGFLNDTTSYTSFIVAPSSGTMTGGTIAVYGYAKD